ncbi:unnamed protein product [Linum trigynum]|uniref:Uncharacterized protein n=1 Tax=Linum trigynum TaxID=586398 RepID=A0AAV2F7Z1_9ROSI
MGFKSKGFHIVKLGMFVNKGKELDEELEFGKASNERREVSTKAAFGLLLAAYLRLKKGSLNPNFVSFLV